VATTRMQQRRGTAEQWTIIDPVLAEGELGFESDTSQFKIGDGVNNWSNLTYFVNEDNISENLDDYVPITLLGQPDGVATLDENGVVPSSQLDIDFSSYYTATDVDDRIGDVTVDGTEGNTIADRIATAVSDGLATQDELSKLQDVVIASPQNGDALLYDGTDWKNQQLSVDPNPQIFMLMGS